MDKPKYKKIGYARASSATSKFGLESQIAALKADGCDQIFSEVISTKVQDSDRPQLQAALAAMEEDSELVQAITANLNALKQEYQNAFSIMAPQKMAPNQ